MTQTTPTPGDQHETYSHDSNDAATQHFSTRSAFRQAAFLLPHLHAGMRLLDCGCGTGTITVGLAEVVAPGEVVGVDIGEPQLAQAREEATSRGLTNVRFETASVYDLPYPDASFDAVYSNALLSHLSKPVAALTEIHRVLKPGGVVAIRNPDTDGQIIAPAASLLVQALDIYTKVVSINGGNAKIGKHHKGLLREAGFTHIAISAAYEVYASDEEIGHWGRLWVNGLRDESAMAKLAESGLATTAESLAMSQAWQEWSEHPDAFFADAWFAAIGRKP